MSGDFYLNNKWLDIKKIIANSGQVQETSLPYFEAKLVSLTDKEAVLMVPAFINYSIMKMFFTQ